jgi:uncharacterized protein
MNAIANQLAQELNASVKQVTAATQLMDEGATVPFIARYRKEVTGGLDDGQLRLLEQRLGYLRELEDRRTFILKTVTEQDKLTEQLKADINAAVNKTELEDLYLPFKPKRRTKGQIAIEAGLEPLAEQLFNDPSLDAERVAADFIQALQNIDDVKSALDGAKFILMERFAEDAKLLSKLRQFIKQHGYIESKVIDGKEKEGAKYQDYFAHSEALTKVPSHRALAMLRARNEGVISLVINPDPSLEDGNAECIRIIAKHLNSDVETSAWLKQVFSWTWKIKLALYLENEFLAKIRDTAEQGAIDVFAKNLNDLLMAAPAGAKKYIRARPWFTHWL